MLSFISLSLLDRSLLTVGTLLSSVMAGLNRRSPSTVMEWMAWPTVSLYLQLQIQIVLQFKLANGFELRKIMAPCRLLLYGRKLLRLVWRWKLEIILWCRVNDFSNHWNFDLSDSPACLKRDGQCLWGMGRTAANATARRLRRRIMLLIVPFS